MAPARLRWRPTACASSGLRALDSICCNKSGISPAGTKLTAQCCRDEIRARREKLGHGCSLWESRVFPEEAETSAQLG